MSMYPGCCAARFENGSSSPPESLKPPGHPSSSLPPDRPANLCQIFPCKTFLFFPLSLPFSSCLRRLATTGPTVFDLISRSGTNITFWKPPSQLNAPAPSFSILPAFFCLLLQHSSAQPGTHAPSQNTGLARIPSHRCLLPRIPEAHHLLTSDTGRRKVCPSPPTLQAHTLPGSDLASFDNRELLDSACDLIPSVSTSRPSKINNLITSCQPPSAAAVSSAVDRQPFNCLSLTAHIRQPLEAGPALHRITIASGLRVASDIGSTVLRRASRTFPTHSSPIPTPIFFPFALPPVP